MDFDEYEYLEKTVENPHLENEAGNGGGDEKAKSEVKERSRSSRHRSDEKKDEDEDGRRSKRSRSHHRSRSRDRERDRHRSSREHRDKERDRDREKSRDKEERNGKERERDKDKDRDSKGRDHEKDRERDRSRRSRSRSERHRSQEREKSLEIETKERDTKDRDRDRRRHKDKKEDKVEPEADPERDQRTVFAYQIALRATERDVYEFFSRAGKVRDVRIIMDRISRRSRGIGYVEFYDTMSVPMAIALSGQTLLGQPVMVKPSEAEKNLVQSTTAAAGAGGSLGPYSGGARRLYVGNLHVNMSEDDLRKVFEPFGSVELVQVPRDETGQCKGFGFVQFARLEDARNALNLNGQLEIAGRAIKVSAVTDQTEVPEGGQMQNTGDLDDDDGAGLSLNAQSEVDVTQLTGRKKKLFELRLKMNEARKSNQTDVGSEKKKMEAPTETKGISKQKWLEERKKKIGKLLDANGLDMTKAYMLDTQEAAETKYKKWEKEPSGWDVFNQKTLYNAYKKRTKNVQVDLEEYNRMRAADPEFYREASSLQYGKAPKTSKDKIDKMAQELHDREQKRQEFSRRRKFREEKDIDSINDRNEHFNKKIERAFGKYTLEIKNNLERGTALPD